MVFGLETFVDMYAWCAGKPHVNGTIRKGLAVLSCSTVRGQHFLSQIVNLRNDRATRLRYAESFFAFLLGKLDPGFSLKLRQLELYSAQLHAFAATISLALGVGSSAQRQPNRVHAQPKS